VHRRNWGRLYDALTAAAIGEATVRGLLASSPLERGTPIDTVDASVGARCDAETSPERVCTSHPSRHATGQPIVAGWSSHRVAQLGLARDSWTAPLAVQRLRPGQDVNALGADQLTPPAGGARFPPFSHCSAHPQGLPDGFRLCQTLSRRDNGPLATR
jgi:hypothetical protein